VRRAGGRGFTLVELLVVMAIIAVLASLLIVGVGAATRRAQRGNTAALLTSLSQAISRFKSDNGYYPPVLGDPRSLAAGGAALGWATNLPFSVGPAPGAVANFMPTGSLGWMRDLLPPPLKVYSAGTRTKVAQWTSAESRALQRWNSVTSLAEYLVGPGDRAQDGFGICGDMPDSMPSDPKRGLREVPREGIRAPGVDGVWGAALSPVLPADFTGTTLASNYTGAKFGVGLFGSRNLAVPARSLASQPVPLGINALGNDDAQCLLRNQPNLKGKSLGPYLELKDPSNLGGIRGIRSVGDVTGDGVPDFDYDVVRGTDGDPNFELYPKCVVDFWGTPIRYYRRGYLNLTPTQADKSADGSRFDLGDFFVLRPSNASEGDFLDVAEATREALDDENPDLPFDPQLSGRDRSSTRRLRAAEFALLSYGPDRRADLSRRVNFSGPKAAGAKGRENVNEDNMVETGP
jgi:prepilin-type N-terminal cleavage/methylation domain-containing protein